MSVMSVRIEEDKRKLLKVFASLEGKTISGLVAELIEMYLEENRSKLQQFAEAQELQQIMKVSESSFEEWENDEDSVYDEM